MQDYDPRHFTFVRNTYLRASDFKPHWTYHIDFIGVLRGAALVGAALACLVLAGAMLLPA